MSKSEEPAPAHRKITLETPILHSSCTLGEGPLFDPNTSILHFVDIDESKLWHYDTINNRAEIEQFEKDESVTCLALRQGGGLACAATNGYAIITSPAPFSTLSKPTSVPPTTKGTLEYFSTPLPEKTHKGKTRFNDGACDARGRFWAGTLWSWGSEPKGKDFMGGLWRFDPETGKTDLIDEDDITDSNGIGWTVDNKTMYFVNSVRKVIYAYDYDIETGSATNRRIYADFNKFPDQPGFPDGFCFDDQGCVWSAKWSGSRIFRLSPDAQTIDLEIHLPTAWSITACEFGGKDNDVLYITTAKPFLADGFTVDEERMKEYPHSGDLFALEFKGEFKGGLWRHSFKG